MARVIFKDSTHVEGHLGPTSVQLRDQEKEEIGERGLGRMGKGARGKQKESRERYGPGQTLCTT